MSSIYDRLGTLGNPARVRMLRLLEVEELGVGELAKVVQMPQSTVSRHLKVLHDDGWLDRRSDGPATFFALAELPPEEAALWSLVRDATDGEHADDALRLTSVLAQRQADSRAFFGRVAGGWREVRQELFGTDWLPSTLLALLPDDLVVADLGCGPGDAVAMLAPWCRTVIGIDREPAMIAAAEARVGDLPGVELRQGTLEDPPLGPGEVDVVLLMLVLHHVERPGAVLAALGGLVGDSGRVVLVDMVDHDRDAYRRSMGHLHLGFSAEEVARIAAAGALRVRSHRVLPPEPDASGPALFVAVLGR